MYLIPKISNLLNSDNYAELVPNKDKGNKIVWVCPMFGSNEFKPYTSYLRPQ